MDILLTREQAISPYLETRPSELDYGGEVDLEEVNVKIRVGDNPEVENMLGICLHNNIQLPDSLEVFTEFKVWMVTNFVSVLQEPGRKRIEQLTIEVRLSEQKRITILDQAPQSKFVTMLQINNKASLHYKAAMHANGMLTSPALELASMPGLMNADGGMQGELDAEVSGGIVKNIEYEVSTPKIIALGRGNTYGYWTFYKDDKGLTDDHRVTLTLLVPKGQQTIDYSLRVGATISTYNFLPHTLRSQWIPFSAELPELKGIGRRI